VAIRRLLLSILRFLGAAPEVPSPPGMIDFDDVSVENGTLTIKNIPAPLWIFSNPFDTDSMDGAYDVGHSPIMICNREFIDRYADMGAWISWRLKNGVGRFHQIVEIGSDEEGWYCKTAGLNLGAADPYKIRKADITAIAIGILWTKPSDKVIYTGG